MSELRDQVKALQLQLESKDQSESTVKMVHVAIVSHFIVITIIISYCPRHLQDEVLQLRAELDRTKAVSVYAVQCRYNVLFWHFVVGIRVHIFKLSSLHVLLMFCLVNLFGMLEQSALLQLLSPAARQHYCSCVLHMNYRMLHSTSCLRIDSPSISKRLVECTM